MVLTPNGSNKKNKNTKKSLELEAHHINTNTKIQPILLEMNWDQRFGRKQPKKHTKSDQKILKKIPDIKKDPN